MSLWRTEVCFDAQCCVYKQKHTYFLKLLHEKLYLISSIKIKHSFPPIRRQHSGLAFDFHVWFQTSDFIQWGPVQKWFKPISIFLNIWFKEELHNRFNLISEERVNIFTHNSENLMKIGWKIRKLWHFEVSQIFTKHFLTSRYEYANEWVDDVITSLLAIYFVHKILKILIFCPNLW